VNQATSLLRIEQELERAFVAEELARRREAKGWTAALIMFHIAQWRGRLRRGLTDLRDGRPYTPPPANINEFNDSELPLGAGVSLEEASAAAGAALAALIELSEEVGDRPFKWSVTSTSTEALTRNSYLHPRNHLAAYYRENGEQERARRLVEETASDLRDGAASPLLLGAALYNLAGVRVAQGRSDEALSLLEEVAPVRPDLAAAAAGDADLAPLRGEARLRAIAGLQ
jgi:tetratricopeptide (TPR) repeat protein